MTKLIIILIKVTGVKLTKALLRDMLACVSEIYGLLQNTVVDIRNI
jgi:hypothetical protein